MMIKKELVIPGMEYRRDGYSRKRRVVRLEVRATGTKVHYRELDGTEGVYINWLRDFSHENFGFHILTPAPTTTNYSIF